MLKLTVIVPTLNRSETLYWCLKTCIEQDYQNYEIIVSDNCSNDNTSDIVSDFNDPRIKYIKPEKRLAMSDHWEFALSHVNEGYVMFIGDDDGLLPNCMTHIAKLLNEFNVLGFMSYPVIYQWTNNTYGFYNDNSYFLVNTSGLIDEYAKVIEYYPEFWLSPTLYHGMISIEVIKKIIKRDKRFFNSLYPDIYSNVILMPEMDKYLLSYMPFCIDGVSKYSTGSAVSSTHLNNGLAKEIRDNFFANTSLLSNHPKLETPDMPIKSWPYSLVISEPILQAHERNSDIPSLDIKYLLKKIIFHDSYRRRYEHDDTELILNTAKNIAKINGLESFFEEIISERRYLLKDNRILNRLNFKINNLKNKKNNNINNVYEMSLTSKQDRDYSPNNISYKPLDTVVNNQNINYFRSDIVMNTLSKSPLKKIPKNSYFYENMSFFIKYLWSNKYYDIPEGHFILKQDWNYSSLPEEWINRINSSVDEIWVSNNFVFNNYVDSGLDIEKIKIVPLGIDSTFYKKDLRESPFKSEKSLKLLFVGEFNNNSGIKSLLESYNEEFSSKDDISLIIRPDWKETSEEHDEIKNMISNLKNEKSNPEIILMDEFLDNNDMISLYSNCDCFVYPYSQDSTGIHILEAMSCSLPIITTNGGCSLDYCTEDNAYFIDAQWNETDIDEVDSLTLSNNIHLFEINKLDLKNKLRDIFENKEQLIKKGSKSRKIIKNKFTLDRMFKTIDFNLSKLIKKPIIRYNISEIKSEWLNKAFESFKADDYVSAEKLFKKLCTYENNTDYFYNLGVTEFKLNKYEDAVTYLSTSLELGICTYELCNFLSESLYKIGDKENGDIFFQKSLELK